MPGDFKISCFMIKHLYSALHNTLATTIQEYTNQPPQILTTARKTSMSHMTVVAKERRETTEAKFQALVQARQNLTGNRHAANAAEERNKENYYTLGERVNGYHFRQSRTSKAGRNILKQVRE